MNDGSEIILIFPCMVRESHHALFPEAVLVRSVRMRNTSGVKASLDKHFWISDDRYSFCAASLFSSKVKNKGRLSAERPGWLNSVAMTVAVVAVESSGFPVGWLRSLCIIVITSR